MRFNWRGREGWLYDEGAMLDYYEGLECEECGQRCECECMEEEDEDGDEVDGE